MPNTHNTKNFFSHGGNELVIGGKLTFLDGAEVENFPSGTGSGSVTPAVYVADSEASTVAALKTDFNGLLAALRTAGLLSSTAPTAETPAQDEGGGT